MAEEIVFTGDLSDINKQLDALEARAQQGVTVRIRDASTGRFMSRGQASAASSAGGPGAPIGPPSVVGEGFGGDATGGQEPAEFDENDPGAYGSYLNEQQRFTFQRRYENRLAGDQTSETRRSEQQDARGDAGYARYISQRDIRLERENALGDEGYAHAMAENAAASQKELGNEIGTARDVVRRGQMGRSSVESTEAWAQRRLATVEDPQDRRTISNYAVSRMQSEGEDPRTALNEAMSEHARVTKRATQTTRDLERTQSDLIRDQESFQQAQRTYSLTQERDPAARSAMVRGWAQQAGGETTTEGLGLLTQAQRMDDQETSGGGSWIARRLQRVGFYIAADLGVRMAKSTVEAGVIHGREMSLALNDPTQQLAAIEKYNQGVGQLGEIGAVGADIFQSGYYGKDVSRLSTEFTKRSADTTESRTALLGRVADFSRGSSQQFQMAQSATSGGDIVAAQQQAKFDSEAQQRAVTDLRNSDSAAAREQAKAAAAVAVTTRNAAEIAALPQSGQYGSFGNRWEDFTGTGARGVVHRAQAASFNMDVMSETQSTMVGVDKKLNDKYNPLTEEARQTERLRVQLLQRKWDAMITMSDTGFRASIQRAEHNEPGAAVTGMAGQTAAQVIEAPNTLKLRVLRDGVAKIFDFLAETGRNLFNSEQEAKEKTREAGQLLTGDRLGASISAIDYARDAAIRALPNNALFDPLKRLIRGQAAGEEELAAKRDVGERFAVGSQIQVGENVARLQAQRRPYSAQATEIAESAKRAALAIVQAGGPDAQANAAAVLREAGFQEQSLQNELVLKGSGVAMNATAIGPGFLSNSERETPTQGARTAASLTKDLANFNPTQVMHDIAKTVKQIMHGQAPFFGMFNGSGY